MFRVLPIPLLALAWGCAPEQGGSNPVPATTADSDADADADSDSDSDADTDTEPVSDADHDGSPDDVDCDDANPDVYPGAPDVCGDDAVTDCDRLTDDGLVTVNGAATYDSLEAALAAAGPGDEILVCAGTYTGAFVATVPVQLTSHQGRDLTILSGGGKGTTLTLEGGSSVTGFTIRDGESAGSGGGIAVVSSGAFTATDCLVTENHADTGGGVWLSAGVSGTMTASSISGNAGETGGGGVLLSSDSSLDLTTSDVTGNTAANGGGVMMYDADLVGGSVTGNEATWYYGLPYYEWGSGGGGLFVGGHSTVAGTDVGANFATNTGGGGIAMAGGVLTLADTAVHDNVSGGGGGLSVWGLYPIDADLTLVGTTSVNDNHAFNGGGAVVNAGTITGGTFDGNEADGAGGGVFLYNESSLVGATVTHNSAAVGAGVELEYGAGVTASLIDSNNASGRGGGLSHPLHAYDYSTSHVTQCTITNNTATDGAGIDTSGNLVVADSTVADNTATNSGGGIAGSYFLLLRRSTIARNVAQSGGGMSLSGVVTSFTGKSNDWGDGADDNVPDDISYSGVSYDCIGDVCTPAP